jgi:hypothetical protein
LGKFGQIDDESALHASILDGPKLNKKLGFLLIRSGGSFKIFSELQNILKAFGAGGNGRAAAWGRPPGRGCGNCRVFYFGM